MGLVQAYLLACCRPYLWTDEESPAAVYWNFTRAVRSRCNEPDQPRRTQLSTFKNDKLRRAGFSASSVYEVYILYIYFYIYFKYQVHDKAIYYQHFAETSVGPKCISYISYQTCRALGICAKKLPGKNCGGVHKRMFPTGKAATSVTYLKLNRFHFWRVFSKQNATHVNAGCHTLLPYTRCSSSTW